MTLWLRRADIANGEREAAQSCPIALALRRRGSGQRWHVDGLVAIPDQGKPWFLGPDARDFMFRFDERRHVGPGYVHLYRERRATSTRTTRAAESHPASF